MALSRPAAAAKTQNDLISRSGARATAGTKAWIVCGAFWFALFIYCMTAWVLGPDFVPNTFGRDQASPGYVTFIRTLEVIMLTLTAFLLWWFVFRPLFRDRKMSFDGLFFLACGTMVLQEPWHAWIRPQLLYNTIFFNYGSWMGTLPVSSPTAQMTPLPIAFAGLGYFWIVAGPAWCGSKFMSRLKTRDPGISTLKLVLYGFLAFCVFDLIIESFITRTGMFIYASTVPWYTLFAGTPHQFPLTETICWAGTYTFLACFHFFRNDRGETWADRNLDAVQLPASMKTFARWLAMVGVCQMIILGTWNIPYLFFALKGDTFVVTEESHPWLTAGMCGTSTPYDCPGPGVPFARRESPTNRIAPLPAPAAP